LSIDPVGFKTALSATILSVSILVSPTPAQDAPSGPVTFSRDVLPILQHSCQECHRPAGKNFGGMVAPMSLVSYEDARPWAKAIAQQVGSREMPPWDAAPRFNGHFANERTLTDAEIETILAWARQGAPRGDPADAPPPVEFETTGGWNYGEPDLVVTIPEAYKVSDDAYDLYTAFTVDLTDAMLPEDVYIAGFQCKPGTPIIHHFNAHVLYPDEEGNLPPPPNQVESSSISPQGAGFYLGGVSSGTDANIYPEGYGMLLQKGSRVTFDIHYHKEPGPGTGVVDDQSQIGFYFTDGPPKAALKGMQLFNFNISIQPEAKDHVIGPVKGSVREDSKIVALMPHMHTRGRRAKFEAIYPDGTREDLLEVPAYDFNWQTVYYFREMKPLPAGSAIEFTAWYDNSSEYAQLRDFDPTQTVRFGQKSSDEMMMGFVVLAPVIE
jgi:mono/diheme cytochrome c family protein